MDKIEVVARSCRPAAAAAPSSSPRTKRTAARLPWNSWTAASPPPPSTATWARAPREQALRAFRNNKVDVLVATDGRRPRHRRRRRHPRHQYQCVEDEKIYLHRCGPHGPRRQQGHRRDLRRLGRHAPLGPDQQGPWPERAGAGGNLLFLSSPLRGTRHPRRAPRAACRATSACWPASTPKSSRTSARPARRTLPARTRRRT